VGILGNDPKQNPMHYGEIFDVWSFSAKAKFAISCYQAFLNHAGDADLKDLLRTMIHQEKQAIEECDALILDNGLAPAPVLPERPVVKSEEIPVGARFSDQEIAAALAADASLGLAACSQVMGMCTREDIAALFGKFHANKAAISARILKLNKEKGWLIPPPLHVRTPELVEA